MGGFALGHGKDVIGPDARGIHHRHGGDIELVPRKFVSRANGHHASLSVFRDVERTDVGGDLCVVPERGRFGEVRATRASSPLAS